MGELVSVVVTTYKRSPNMVVRSINSIINQTYSNIEIIVVDDSPADFDDRTKVYEAVMNLEDSRIVYMFNEKNIGACASRNKAIQACKGSYVIYVDDDDELTNDCIEKRLKKFTAPEIGLVYSDCFTVDEEKNTKRRTHQAKHSGMVFDELIKDNFIYAFPLIRKECFEKCGLFDINMQAAQDIEMWLRIAKEYQIDYIDEPLAIVHLHSGERISKNPKKKIQGLERLNYLYREYLECHKDALYIRTIKLVPFYWMDKKRIHAIALYLKAIRLQPFKLKSNILYFLKMIGINF